MRRKRYIHELTDWPAFRWDAPALVNLLARVRHKQGLLLGKLAGLGFEIRREAGVSTLTDDVVKTSAIEGEHLDHKEVRSSIARRLGIDAAGLPAPGRQVEGVVAMMLDATQRHAEPLTAERLFAWHRQLFPDGRSGMFGITSGGLRTDANGPMQVVSGPMGWEKVHFEAPGAARLATEFRRFLEWFEGPAEEDGLLRAGLAHFWFVTIHPFDDGNGRIARAIADMALARADSSSERFYSMSSQIEKDRRGYYEVLEQQQSGTLDVTPWLAWFLGCLERAIDSAERSLAGVMLKARVWAAVNPVPVNERQKKVLNLLLGDFKGFLTSAKYGKLAGCSHDTALRDIQELVERGILVRNPGGGRSTSYRLADPDAMR